MPDNLGIYIHIPFCASKCSYCDFYSLAGKDNLMDDYFDALLLHLKESAPQISKYTVDTVYFGGGTPSYFGADRIVDIFNFLKLNGNVRVDSEVTVEVNPDSTSYTALKLMRDEGINRLSIGVQSANSDILKIIGRRHSYEQAVRTIEDARRAGFDNISLDLIYGLPTQTREDWAESLARAVSLHPEHISCYGLTLEPGTPMYKNYKDSPMLPDDDTQADMYCYAVEMLKRYGYEQYEVSNFCARGFESRHNLKYWNLEDYMGFGPGAHSYVDSVRYSYVRDLKNYISGVRNPNAVIVDEYGKIEPLERAVEYIMLGMRTSRGISEYDYHVKCKCDWRPILATLELFASKGWAERSDEGRWHFTVPGFLISNTLINIMLEAQATGRVESVPWIKEALADMEKTEIPLTDDEAFIEIYKQRISGKKL